MAKTENKMNMTKEDELKYINWAGNLSMMYADFVSGKTFDFLTACRKEDLRHEEKRAVGLIESQRKIIEATISKCVAERELFAEITQRLEDAAGREYRALEYAMENAAGRTECEHWHLVGKGLALYALCLNIEASFTGFAKRLKQLRHYRPKKVTADVSPLKREVMRLVNILTKKNTRFVNLDEDEVVTRASKCLTLRLANKDLLEEIFTD